jgi:hypothetical protein
VFIACSCVVRYRKHSALDTSTTLTRYPAWEYQRLKACLVSTYFRKPTLPAIAQGFGARITGQPGLAMKLTERDRPFRPARSFPHLPSSLRALRVLRASPFFCSKLVLTSFGPIRLRRSFALLGASPYAVWMGGSQMRNPPRNALALLPARQPGGKSFSFFTLPPPRTTSSGSRAAIKRATISAT